MATDAISPELRRIVESRARGLCEYCLVHEQDTFFGAEVDPIISRKHGGQTVPENLADERLLERQEMREAGVYPRPQARGRADEV